MIVINKELEKNVNLLKKKEKRKTALASSTQVHNYKLTCFLKEKTKKTKKLLKKKTNKNKSFNLCN